MFEVMGKLINRVSYLIYSGWDFEFINNSLIAKKDGVEKVCYDNIESFLDNIEEGLFIIKVHLWGETTIFGKFLSMDESYQACKKHWKETGVNHYFIINDVGIELIWE